MSTRLYLCVFVLTFFIAISYNEVHGLQCYQCSSLEDENCGDEFDTAAGRNFIVDCADTDTGCKKLKYTETIKGEYWVTRSCHNSKTVSDGDSPDGCYDLPNDGDSCYCYDANEPCNGQESKVLSLVLLSIGVLLCWLY